MLGTLMTIATLATANGAERTAIVGKPPRSTIPLDSPGQFAFDQFVMPVGLQLRRLSAQGIALPAKSRVSRSTAPLKQITLLGGDRITAEIRRWDAHDGIELRLQGGQLTTVSRLAVNHISAPRGESELLYEPFEDASAAVVTSYVSRPSIDPAWIEEGDAASDRSSLNLANVGQPLNYEFTTPLNGGRIQFWFRVDRVEAETQPTALQIEFDLAADRSEPLKLSATGNEVTVTVPDWHQLAATKQRVVLKRGWHCLTAALFEEHALVTVDDALLLSMNRSLGSVKTMRFSGAGHALLDDLQVSQFHKALAETSNRPSTKDDCLTLTDGDQWFGSVSAITPSSVVMSDATGERTAAWSQIAGIALRQLDSAASRPLSAVGLQAVIQLQGNLDRPQQIADRICAMIVDVNRDFIVIVHPWLGRLALGWNQIARLEPQFFGRSLTLDARSKHLGDAIREDFQRQVPDGLDWPTKFSLAAPMPAEIWLSLDVVDLEPAGSQTPPASPFLKELRTGQLLTQITVNNKPAGDLNRWIRFRATPDSPERIRCLLPAGLLQAGENSLRLHQIPLKTGGRHFDNCELSNLRLEFVEPLR